MKRAGRQFLSHQSHPAGRQSGQTSGNTTHAPPVLVLPPLCRPSRGLVAMEMPPLPFYYWVSHAREGSGCFSAPPWGLSEDLSLYSLWPRQIWKTWKTQNFRKNIFQSLCCWLIISPDYGLSCCARDQFKIESHVSITFSFMNKCLNNDIHQQDVLAGQYTSKVKASRILSSFGFICHFIPKTTLCLKWSQVKDSAVWAICQRGSTQDLELSDDLRVMMMIVWRLVLHHHWFISLTTAIECEIAPLLLSVCFINSNVDLLLLCYCKTIQETFLWPQICPSGPVGHSNVFPLQHFWFATLPEHFLGRSIGGSFG